MTHTQLLLNSSFHEHRRVNSWNAFLKAKLNEVNSGRDKGDHFKLPSFIARYKEELLAEYWKLTPAEKQTLKAKVQAAHDSKPPPARANPKTVNQAVTAAFSKMDKEWQALCARTVMEGLFLAV
ncbi:hypothetical protein JVT61DRAFT_12163 [Boletus reticuloceps]|uniref:Uncharacterized protein n=1 Tax=Boletus reticuloceps TaxID=495285 RepID=A0A8I2YE34_9AGAM|nr:hypothetical protein JVT61DRAFT_12163 [Boletus reticuloceps]